MAESKMVPQLRFRGFTDDWEQHKVSEICSISTGKSNTQDKIDDGAYPFYVRSPIIERSNRYLYNEEAVLTVGDGVGTGKVFHYVNGKYDLHQRVYRLFGFSNEVDAKFFYHWFSENFYNRVMSMTAKTSVDSVRLEMIAGMEMFAPSYDEQRKISAFLGCIDNLITIHQNKYDKLLALKKSMLEKMFPKAGSDASEIRFAGFTGAWEQRKLGDVLSLLKDGTHGTHKDSDCGPYLLSAKNIKNGQIVIDDSSDRKISQDAYEQIHSTFKLQKNDVLLTIVGSIGETAILENTDSLTFQRSVAFLRPNEKITSRFLRTEIETDRFQKELQDRKSQSAQSGVYLGELEKLPVMFPKTDEQEKIGDYFYRLDDLIALHQRKYEKLKQIKQSMLEKMFV